MNDRGWLRGSLLRPLINAIIFGVIFAGCVLYIEFNENRQGEYYDSDSGAINVPLALTTFSAFACSVALIVITVEVAAFLFMRVLRRYWPSRVTNAYANKIFVLPLIDAIILGAIVLGGLTFAVSDPWSDIDLSALAFPPAFVATLVFIVELAVQFGMNRLKGERLIEQGGM